MQLVVMAVVPVTLLLALGTVLRRRLGTDTAFWRGIEWMSYRVFTPALIFTRRRTRTSAEENRSRRGVVSAVCRGWGSRVGAALWFVGGRP